MYFRIGLLIESFVNFLRVLYIEVLLLKMCFGVALQGKYALCVELDILHLISLKHIIQNIHDLYFILVSFHIVFPIVSL